MNLPSVQALKPYNDPRGNEYKPRHRLTDLYADARLAPVLIEVQAGDLVVMGREQYEAIRARLAGRIAAED